MKIFFHSMEEINKMSNNQHQKTYNKTSSKILLPNLLLNEIFFNKIINRKIFLKKNHFSKNKKTYQD